MATMNLSDVSSKYGAPMGRSNSEVSADEVSNLGKFELQQVRINQGGYDAGGAYWGTGAPLYRARAFVDFTGRIGHNDGVAEMFFRAPNRDAAKAIVTAKYPGARFFR